jgi:PPE-repeat protein
MTAYFLTSAMTAAPSGGYNLALRAVTYELRIVKIGLYGWTGGGMPAFAYRHENSTLSGGTAQVLTPLHQGAPAASATAMVGPSLAYTGTSKVVGSTYIPPASSSSIVGTTVIVKYTGSSAEILEPLTLTLAPGSVLEIRSSFNYFATFCEIHFEEMRLAGSY